MARTWLVPTPSNLYLSVVYKIAGINICEILIETTDWEQSKMRVKCLKSTNIGLGGGGKELMIRSMPGGYSLIWGI